MNDREWLAREFEQLLAPEKLDEALTARAYAHFNALLLQYGTGESVDAPMSTEADAALATESTIKRATKRAALETAAALRKGEI